MAGLFSHRKLALTLVLFLSSWAVVQAGIYLGRKHVSAGEGLSEARAVSSRDLFRFDSLYYLKISHEGYSYNGDPGSSPNIVFAPMFPFLASVISFAPIDPVLGGLILNKALFFVALFLLLSFLSDLVGLKKAFWVLFAMGTAAGAYAFHAYYSESTMLFFLGLALVSYQRRWRYLLAIAACGLGASRLTAAPIAVGFALLFLRAAWLNRKNRVHLGRDLACAVLSVLGVAIYLGYIGYRFGNPFLLLPEIQETSWGRFHPPADALDLVTFTYLFNYWGDAFARGWSFFDIRCLNLIWTTLALAASVYTVVAWGRGIFAYVFIIYFMFIYCADSSSEFLISAHRFFTPMLPIYLMGAALAEWIGRRLRPEIGAAYAATLLVINLGFGILHTAYFNQGVWFFF